MENQVSEILSKYAPIQENLLLVLHDVQANDPQQYLSEESLRQIASYLRVSMSTVYGFVQYYSLFGNTPRGKNIIRICASPICNAKQSCNLRKIIGKKLKINNTETTKDGLFTLETVECLGLCDVAPAMLINDKVYGNLDSEKTIDIINSIIKGDKYKQETNVFHPEVKGEERIILKDLEQTKALSLEQYIANGGMQAFERSLQMTSDKIVQEIIDSGLRGRGGAGFSTGIKWKFTLEQKEKRRFVVCNADEGEPGTFKDRPIMEMLPFLYLEGLMIAAKAVNAEEGKVYIRGEYSRAIKQSIAAVGKLREAGYLGKQILGSSFNLDIDIIVGAGSYLCGDEMTLLESMEGKRGYPRIKPPFPAEKGFKDLPTLVNNVETLANIPVIIRKGVEYFRSFGTDKSSGTKIFPISGDVVRSGYYEVPFGKTLDFLIHDLAGGIADNRAPLAVLLGGAAGTFINLNDIKNQILGYDELAQNGYVLGSGAVIVFDETRSMYDILYSILKFFSHESCGKCVPCRVGTTQLQHLMKTKHDKSLTLDHMNQMLQQAEMMEKTSLCALGQSPVLSIRSLVQHYSYLFK